jgi:hypothetical protein
MVRPDLSTINKTVQPFDYWVQKVLPTVYDESLSYYELLTKVVQQLNDIGTLVNDTTGLWNDVNEWMVNEGVEEITAELLEEKINSGAFDYILENAINTKANQDDLIALQNQVTTIVANSTATEGNTELIDARLNADGFAHATLGEHVRHTEESTTIARKKLLSYASTLPTLDPLTNGQYVQWDNKQIVTHSGYGLTYPIECEYGDVFEYTGFIYGNLLTPGVIYDANMVLLDTVGGRYMGSSTQALNKIIRIENKNAKFIRFQTSNTRVKDLTIRKELPIKESIDIQKRTRGYYRAVATPRQGMSDRFQMMVTFDIGSGGIVEPFYIPFERGNNLKAVSYRLYGSLEPDTYEQVIDYYSAWGGENIYNHLFVGRDISLPVDSTTGTPTRYLQVFIDGVLTNPLVKGELTVPKFLVNGKPPISAKLNWGTATDKFYAAIAYAELSPLYKKRIVGIGDSLLYGSVSGNDITWFNKLGGKYDMDFYNYGDNGNPIADHPDETNPSMVERYMNMVDGADYIIVQGSANDRRLDVPMGDNDSTDIKTFKGALNVMLDGLLAKYPKGKILCMTNYNRFETENGIGLTDLDYVNAMLEICRLKGIKCFDNFHDSGIDFHDPIRSAWQDEGIVLDGVANVHLSDEAYTWLLPKYEKVIEGL